MTPADVLFGLACGLVAAIATALAIIALPVVRSARAYRRRQR